ncbi:sensory rhodopsin transducer [Kribbella sp. NPDC051952]|uniref:sensory rhodopsin transducer n=1 Tax=Kribbella sp. NPDC051952 TaxID=3154851 RepID=UPI00344AF08E
MIGTTTWVISDGYVPPGSSGDDPALASHESACMLNTNAEPARVELTVYFADREPAGPHVLTIPGRRIWHQRLDELVPAGTDYSVVIQSDRPIVVQHTRLDSRQAANALMTTIAFPAG